MPRRPGPLQRIGAVAATPVGVALTSWSYIWRTTAIHRRELEGSQGEDLPAPLPPGVTRDDVQLPDDGSGPLFRRTYTAVVEEPACSAAELVAFIAADPNRVAPSALARFKKTKGEPWRLRAGDEFIIRMPGPWDGPVRAVEVTPTSFRFATLAGHLEAGQIEWRAAPDDGRLVFQIESRARAGDRLSALLHDRARMAKEVQLHMWISVVERVAKKAGGRLAGGVSVETRRVDPSAFG
jgi:hypothetical protein